nr:hypothetical protein [uncultured Enterobacter sp.]
MSDQTASAPAAENKLSKKDKNTVVVYHASCLCYFRIETLELIFLDESDATAFDDLMTPLSMIVAKHHMAKNDYSTAVEVFALKRTDIANKEELPKLESAIAEAENKLSKAAKALQEQIGDFDEQKGYPEVIELIPLEPLKKGIYGRFYSYIKKKDFDTFDKSGKLNVIKLDIFSDESIFKRDKDKNITSVDVKAIVDKLNKAKKTIDAMLSKKKKAAASIHYETILTDWAEAWNAQYEKYSKEGTYIDVSAGAQFLRLSANTAYQASWDPDSGKGAIKGEASAELALFAGKVDATLYAPDRVGWQLKCIINDDNKEANLGVLRAKIDTGLTGYAGASAQIEANLQFVTSDNQQKIMGLRAPASKFKERQSGVVVKTEGEAPLPMEVKVGMFAGIKAGGKVGGALQWLKPFHSLVEELPTMIKTMGIDVETATLAHKLIGKGGRDAELGKFTDFCSLTLSGDVELGIGYSGEFQIIFKDGRFKFHVAASACLGPGAKGDIKGEITPSMFMEFAVWTIYQLHGIDYKHFKIISEEAFKVFTYILLMGGKEKYEKYYHEISADLLKVATDFSHFIKKNADDFSDAKDTSEKRNNIALLINKDPGQIYLLTPEGKGALLHLLTGDGAYDRIDYKNQGDGFLPDTGYERKKAILYILSSIQTKREWRKVLSRITSDGSVIPAASSSVSAEFIVVKEKEKIICDILQIGFDRIDELNAVLNKLELNDFNQVYQRLKDKPSFGYPFAPNCSKSYLIHCDDNPFYRSLCYFVPEDPTIKHKLEPMQ